MYKISVYVPPENAEAVKNALFRQGAGKIGNYDACCWQTTGTGQFRPLPDSQPHIGEQGKIETVEELKIELVCEKTCLRAAIAAMLEAHPYETPAYDVIELVNVEANDR